MTRKTQGWENRLIEYLNVAARTGFRPGTFDCAMFFAGAVEAMTGIDFAEQYRGKYKTIDGGLDMLNDRGYLDHLTYVETLFEEWPSPIYAQRGDGAAILDERGHPALGIVQGEKIYAMGLTGLGLRPLSDAVKAFKI